MAEVSVWLAHPGAHVAARQRRGGDALGERDGPFGQGVELVQCEAIDPTDAGEFLL
ncbi:hypothetical protein [Amycolatopsis sp. lyj-108]|uniref:hypothetical protein n=1 Tax=Amycolatopsis sp. lyj-108 TaxID=2789286 RepID=UPI00397BD70A